ncbi:MAG: hypothetical protein HC857_11405 [Synechococcales cyanobacterium RU_4_20]|nr:hypothetical protein [Synechococcales cyanobacterium RU_4_20]NJR67665.1 hypothetical protein [Synechococcales cyanobacterium CRU_2_2]
MTRFAYAEPLPAVALSLVRAPAPDKPSGFNQPGEVEPPFRKHLRRRERLPLDSRALWEIESGFFGRSPGMKREISPLWGFGGQENTCRSPSPRFRPCI